MFISLFTLAATISSVFADHIITLTNSCGCDVPVFVDSAYSPVRYTGQQPGVIGAFSSVDVAVPTRWNSRICHDIDGTNCADGKTRGSMAEFNMDAPEGLDYYDISNIEGFSVAQGIRPHNTSPYGGCQAVKCASPNCACDQAYRYGDESGCGDDRPVKACPSGDFTITYCP